MPDEDTGLATRDYIDRRLERLADETADRAAILLKSPEDAVSPLTFIESQLKSLREAVSGLRDLIYQRFDAESKAVSAALVAQEKAVSAALAAVEEQTRGHAASHDREHGANERIVNASFAALSDKTNAMLKAHDDQHMIARQTDDRERESIQHQLTAMNEIRTMLSDQTKSFARVEDLQARFEQVNERVSLGREDMLSRMATLERTINTRNEADTKAMAVQTGRGEVSNAVIGTIVAVFISLVIVAVNLVLAT